MLTMIAPLLQPAISPLLVGRDQYLDAFDELAAGVREGNGITLLVSGEAGIGKSRLVAEARERFAAHASVSILQGNCFEHDRGLPYAPFVDLLRGLLAKDDPSMSRPLAVAPELTLLLPELSGQTGTSTSNDPQQDKRRIQDAILRAIDAVAASDALLLIAEDIHWADDLSLELLQRLAQRTSSRPLMLLVTWRNDDVSDSLNHFLATIDRRRLGTELRLERLTTGQIEIMLRAIFDQVQPIRPDFLQTIADLTDGNPFFIEEVLTALIAAGDIYQMNGVWARKDVAELRVPRSVVDAVRQRSGNLSETALQFLNLAAISGQRFDISIIQELLRIDDGATIAAIHELIEARLVVEVSAEQLAFRHALTRRAVYIGLLARERRALHLRLGDALEHSHATMPDRDLAALSYHYHAAGAWEKCLIYARLASDRARSLFAPAAEIEHVNRALDAVRELAIDRPGDLYRQRALAHVTLGQFEQAGSDHEVALALARQSDNRQAEWQSLLDIGMLWSGLDYVRAGEWFQQALDLAQTIGDPLTVAQTLVQIGNWQVNTDRPVDAERSLSAALTIFESVGDHHRIAQTLDLLGVVADIGGQVSLMQQRLEQAIALYRETDDRYGLSSALSSLSGATSGGGFDAAVVPIGTSLEAALGFVDEALAIARDIGWRAGETYALLNQALIFRQLGDLGRAIETAHEATAIAHEIEHREWMACGWYAQAIIALDLLDTDVAVQHAEQALALARSSGSLHFVHLIAGALISTCVATGDLTRAADVDASFDPALPDQTVGQRRLWLARGELALARNDADYALKIADHLLAIAPQCTAESDIPAVAKLRGEAMAAQGLASAEVSLQTAAQGAVSRGMQPLRLQIEIRLAQLHAAAGHNQQAQQATETARMIIETIAASLADQSIAMLFRARELALLPAQSTTPKPAPDNGLTRRERDVALLIAHGRTNREIAEDLYIGERTVETHVSNILGKLGFSSRVQIAAWVVESNHLSE